MAINAQTPKYVQLGERLRNLMLNGELRPGDRLPSYADMYSEYGATPATAQRVYNLLEQENLIERRPGSGVYVAQPQRYLTGNIGFIGNLTSCRGPKIPFYVHLMDGIQRALDSQHQQLLYLGTADSWDMNAFSKVDGVLLCNVDDPTAILRDLPDHLPRVSVLTPMDGVTSVGIDDYRGAQMAMGHLLGHGHRRIACLMEEYLTEGRRRFAGYRDALVKAGIEAEPGWVRLTDTVYGENARWKTAQPYREWGRQQMSAWLQEGWHQTGCTAILVQNEISAIGVMQILQMEGIRVPEDVSIMGFDGTELCDLISPCLSAVAIPLTEIGVKAVEVLNRQIAGEQPSAQDIMMHLSLRPGESVAPVGLISAPN